MARGEDTLGSLKGRKETRPPSRWRQSLMTPAPPKQEEPMPVATETRTPKPQSKGSRMSLFSLFSKPNVERARGHHEAGLQLPERPETPPTVAAPPIPPKSALRPTPSPTPVPPPQQASLDISKMKPLKTASSTPRRSSRHNAHWTPPPLFQAYPQALKYATLTSSTSSAESMLRTQQEHRRQQSSRKETIGSKARSDASQDDGKSDRSSLTSNLASKRLSVTTPFQVSDFTTKIYILVTSGYVLQYAGCGPFDRLPEKVLQLGPDSAAFASDIIAGKHWVLQISQTAQEDGTIASTQRGLMARLRLQNATTRRQASNFLLVLESAQDMDSWLNAVRKEIETLGGKEHKSEAETSQDEPTGNDLTRNPSHRYSLQRDPHRYHSNGTSTQSSSVSTTTSQSPTIVASEWDDATSRLSLNGSESGSIRSSKPSTTPAETMSTISPGGAQLNHLREGSRLSIMSIATSVSDTLTEATSGVSTPEMSPMAETFFKAECEPSRDPTSLKSFAMNPTLGSSRRRSVQTFQLPTTDEDTTDSGSPTVEPVKLQESLPLNYNRAPRYLSMSPEKQQPPAFRRSTSAPAPRIPLPPLPLADSRPLGNVSPPPLSPPPRGRPLPTLASFTPGNAPATTPQSSPGTETVNFSRRRSAMPDLPSGTRLSKALERHGSGQSSISSIPSPRENESSSTPPSFERTTPSPSFNFSLPTSQPMSRSPPSMAQSPQSSTSQTPPAVAPQPTRSLPLRPQVILTAVLPARRESQDLQAIVIPRRRQSAGRPLPLPVKPNRPISVQQPPPQTPSYHQLRRPNSMQIHSNHAPFASNMRSVHRSTSATSVAGPPPTTNISNLLSGPVTKSKSGYFRDNVLTEPLRQHSAPQLMSRSNVSIARLPPRAPPPTMPLPPPPSPNMQRPSPPPNMPLPAPPPNMPLPPTPPQLAV